MLLIGDREYWRILFPSTIATSWTKMGVLEFAPSNVAVSDIVTLVGATLVFINSTVAQSCALVYAEFENVATKWGSTKRTGYQNTTINKLKCKY